MSSQIGYSRRERAAPGHTHTRVGPAAASTTFCLMAMNGSVRGGGGFRLGGAGAGGCTLRSLVALVALLLSVRLSLAGPSRSDTRSRLALTTALTLTFVDCARGTHNCYTIVVSMSHGRGSSDTVLTFVRYYRFAIAVSHICRSKTSIPLLAHYPDTVDAPSVGW
jgi:hypothetical protein